MELVTARTPIASLRIFSAHRRVELDISRISGETLRLWWMNPRTGECSAGVECTNAQKMAFEPPTNVQGEDWVLIVDDASKRYLFLIHPVPSVLPMVRLGHDLYEALLTCLVLNDRLG